VKWSELRWSSCG